MQPEWRLVDVRLLTSLTTFPLKGGGGRKSADPHVGDRNGRVASATAGVEARGAIHSDKIAVSSSSSKPRSPSGLLDPAASSSSS